MNLSPDDIRRLEQAATDALADVDHLAADPETTRRLATYGEPVYGAELTANLEANIRGRMALAGVAAFAVIRLNQANRRVDDLLDELTKVRAQLTADRDKEIGRLEVYVDGLEKQLAAQQPVVNAARNLIRTYATAEGEDVPFEYAASETLLRNAVSRLDTKQPDTAPAEGAASGHVLIVTEPGVWTLKHPPVCPMDCPMFALMHAAMTTADIPAGQYEVQPNGLWDRALIGDRIDGAAVIR